VEFDSPIATGDFNHDGKLDVAIFIPGTPGSVYTLLGNGDGTFQAARTTTVSLGVTGNNMNSYLLAGDFNGDGKLDLLALTANGGVTLLGKGDGTFSASSSSVAAELYEGFLVGDFNRDGKLDLVGFWTFSGTNYLGIFLGNGDGTFQPAVRITNGVRAVTAADFNADGKLDLATVSCPPLKSCQVDILVGHGDGTFTSPVSVPGLHVGASIVAADFNRDGKADLLTYGGGTTEAPSENINPGFMFVAYGKGDGTFQVGPIYLTPPNANQPHPFEGLSPRPPLVGDLNRDGRPDLVLNGNLAADVFLNLP
jgi:FG-GAP-like repeat